MKEKISSYIDSVAEHLVSMSEYIFDNPEIGNKEFKACELLCKAFEAEGFQVEKGIGGLETAFRAIYEHGTGGPSIGILVEYDALEKQGHACGHHMQGPTGLGAALAVRESVQDKPYKLVIYGTPAEETTSGKLTMIKNGCFKDIDVAIMTHANPGTGIDVKSMAAIKYTVTFHGVAAHAALRPEAGRSAFDALLLSFQGVEFLREHVQDDTRIHYTVLDAGGPANSIPAKAVGSFYVRSYNPIKLYDIAKRFEKVLQGAAMMTETTVDIHIDKELKGKIPCYVLNDLAMKNATEFGMSNLQPPREKTGSTDFGAVMFDTPGTCLRVDFVPAGTASHSQAYLDAGKGVAAARAISDGAKTVAGICYDIITQDGLLASIQKDFEDNKTAAAK